MSVSVGLKFAYRFRALSRRNWATTTGWSKD